MACKVCGAEVKNPDSYQHRDSKQHRLASLSGKIKEFFEKINFIPRNTNFQQAGDTIETLNISDAKITEIPAMIEEFPNLTEVRFTSNQITQIPEQLMNMKFLRVLDLSNNEIENIPESWIALASLEELNLSYNNLRKIPAEIFNLPKLKKLDLSGNLILESLWEVLSSIRNTTINSFMIKNMELASLNPVISHLENLEILNLDKNRLDHIPTITTQFRQLKELSVNRNQISKIEEGYFNEYQFRILKSLYLYDNELSELPDDITALRTLTTLGLGHNKFTRFPEQILNMNLRILNLEANDLESVPIELVNTYWHFINLENNPRISELDGTYSKFVARLFDGDIHIQGLDEFRRKVCDRYVRDYIIRGKSVLDLLERVKEDKWKEYIASKSSSIKELLVYRIMNSSFHQLVRDRVTLLQGSNPLMEELETLIGKKIPHLSSVLELETEFGYASIDNRKIVGINLNDSNLEGFPTKLTLFPSLKALFLNDNRITKLPIELGEMISLGLLSISNNQFEGFHPDMSEVPTLEGLRLSGNHYDKILIDYSKFPNLNTLYLENCNLNKVPSEILKLKAMKHLNLSNNSLSEIPKEMIENLKELESLDLSSNNLKTIPKGIESLENLKSLKLKGNGMKKSSIKKEDFRNLEVLEL